MRKFIRSPYHHGSHQRLLVGSAGRDMRGWIHEGFALFCGSWWTVLSKAGFSVEKKLLWFRTTSTFLTKPQINPTLSSTGLFPSSPSPLPLEALKLPDESDEINRQKSNEAIFIHKPSSISRSALASWLILPSELAVKTTAKLNSPMAIDEEARVEAEKVRELSTLKQTKLISANWFLINFM